MIKTREPHVTQAELEEADALINGSIVGFDVPNYTQTPNDLFDKWLCKLGDAELRVILVIVRRTYGYHRDHNQFVKISMSEMEGLTGLSYNGVLSGAKDAERHGLVERRTSGLKTTEWRAVVAPSGIRNKSKPDTSLGEVSGAQIPHPVRDNTSPSEEQVGLKKDKEININKGTPSKKGDRVDAYLEYSQSPQTKGLFAIQDRFNSLFGLNADFENARKWRGLDRWLVRREKEGETIERFVAWYLEDPFRRKLVIHLTSEKIKEAWPQAFQGEIGESSQSNPNGLKVSTQRLFAEQDEFRQRMADPEEQKRMDEAVAETNRRRAERLQAGKA